MIRLSTLRDRHREEDQGTWFISLSDLLTLLLCFFVLMLSVSHMDQERYKAVAASLEDSLRKEKAKQQAQPQKQKPEDFVTAARQAIGPMKPLEPVLPTVLPPSPETSKPEAAKPPGTGPKSIDDIRAELGARFAQDPNAIQLEKREAGVAITVKGAVLFDRASAELTPASVQLLDSIAASLRGTPYKVAVEGHTDNLPIQSWIYPSNWELSGARASRVARFLEDRGVARSRLQVVGFADTKPLAPNTDDKGHFLPENQAKNRRVVILVTP